MVVEHDKRLHPLTAVYRLSVRPLLAELVAAREFKAKGFAERCGAVTLPSSCGFLSIAVVEVGKGPAEVLGVGLHFGERIAMNRPADFPWFEGEGVVAGDGDELDAFLAVFLMKRLQALDGA